MINMPQEFESGDTMIFSHIVSLEDKNEPAIKNDPNENPSSIMIDVLLMILCEQSGSNQSLQDPDLNSD
jgi:hypothetical protein